MTLANAPLGFSTRAIHHAYDPLAHGGALNPPLYLTSTFAFDSVETGAARFAGTEPGYIYGRVGNPTVSVLEARLADLEGGEAALATSSGMGAITAVLWTLLSAGDEVVADLTLYGCPCGLAGHPTPRCAPPCLCAHPPVRGAAGEGFGEKTRLVVTETPSNPNMRLVDIAGLAAICRRAGGRLVVDNTYCTPYLQRPMALGADVVVHSATKYLGGHGDLLAGAVIASRDLVEQFRFVGIKELNGACISAFDAFLVLRGLKTLALRMERHSATALALAHDLEAHPAVARVHHPLLASHPQKPLAERQMRLGGGMIALELKGGLEAGRAFMNAVRLATRAVSLGAAETLIQPPATTPPPPYPPEERARHGFTDGLVRLSIGLEDVEDIRADLLGALDGLGG